MWLSNVVIIITFLFFVLNILEKAVKHKEKYLYVIVLFASIFESIFLGNILMGQTISNFMQILIFIFAYVIPIITIILNTSNIKFRLNILYVVAKLAYSMGKYEFAAGLLLGAIKNDKNNIKYYYLRSKALNKMQDLAGARDMLFKIIELDRENTRMYLELAQILDLENKKDTALVMLSQALKIEPEFTEAKEMIGIIYSDIGRENEAQNIYEELATSGKGTYNTYYNLAIIYWRNGQIDNAIKTYNVALGMNPKLYEANYALGRLYFLSENYEQSIYNLNKALKNNDLKAKIEYALAENYIKLEELEKAAEHLEKAIKLDKTYLDKAKNNSLFEVISLEINRIEDENKELLSITYDSEEVK